MLTLPKRSARRKTLFVVAYALAFTNLGLVGYDLSQRKYPAPIGGLAFVSPTEMPSVATESEDQSDDASGSNTANGGSSAGSSQTLNVAESEPINGPLTIGGGSGSSTTTQSTTTVTVPEPGRGGGGDLPTTTTTTPTTISPSAPLPTYTPPAITSPSTPSTPSVPTAPTAPSLPVSPLPDAPAPSLPTAGDLLDPSVNIQAEAGVGL